MKFMQTLARCALVILFSASALFAQTVTGTVSGTVSDQSGAVIPGANVAAHNTDTGVTSSATSDSAGVYRIGFLPIGPYQVTVEAKGFGTQTLPVFQLEALQTATFNVKLTTGSVSTTVSVSGASPILNTNDATLSSTFTANTIQNFDLHGRFYQQSQSVPQQCWGISGCGLRAGSRELCRRNSEQRERWPTAMAGRGLCERRLQGAAESHPERGHPLRVRPTLG